MWRDEALLLDMLLAAREVRQYTNAKSFDEFNHDKLLQHAVTRLIEVIGEAARNISADFKEAHPQIPWPGIVGMRHRLVHEYFRVAPDKLWEVVKKDLPDLVTHLETLVPPDRPPADRD